MRAWRATTSPPQGAERERLFTGVPRDAQGRGRAGHRLPMRADPGLPVVFTHRQALLRGFTESKILRRTAAGRWRLLRRGVYCLARTWDDATPAGRHVLESAAALLAVAGRPVVSHASAAVLHGLPAPFTPSGVWLTREPPWGTRYLEGVTVEAATLPRGQVERRQGLRVTTLARTVADCLRHLDDVDAVVIGDAALRRRPDVLGAVLEVLAGCESWPYAVRAARRVPLLDGHRESPVESWSYVALHRRGIPLPEPQVIVCDGGGRPVARVDGWWDELAAVAEIDGAVKYGVGADLDIQEARRALFREKRREDALRRLGATVVRWGAAELRDEAGWAAEVREQLAAAEPARFRGSVICPGSEEYRASGFAG